VGAVSLDFFASVPGPGQTEKNSVRAYVFRFALELGHCSTQSACLKGASFGLMHRSKQLKLFDHFVGAGEQKMRIVISLNWPA
jgi:hypothetical protein